MPVRAPVGGEAVPGVLIADGDGERGRRIAAACADLGLPAQVVTHGAAALESALAKPPGALVVQVELPLIDGEQLSGILRTNPRTRDVAAIFLADTSAQAERSYRGGRVVAPPANADDVARIALGLLSSEPDDAKQPAPAADAGGVEGQLSQVGLADLLQLFHVSQKTGAIELRGEGDPVPVGRVLLRGGDVVHAETGSASGEKALYRLLDWDRGDFAFRPGPVDADLAIGKPTRALLREGMRQVEERARLADELPAPDASVRMKVRRASLPIVIHPLTQEVLLVLEAYSRVSDVVEHCSFPDYQVLRTLRTLIDRGIVEVARGQAFGNDGGRRAGLFAAARGERLREWLVARHADGERDAKLLVVAADAHALREFRRLLGDLPGGELTGGELAGGELAGDGGTISEIGPIGRLAVDGEVGMEFVSVPAGPSYAPLWPLAGHGALGVLFVLAGPVGDGLDALRPAAQTLSRLPRARVFHLLLLEKESGIEPEVLRENLSLFDEDSLFLVPSANPETAEVLLREMFVQILP